MNFSWYALTLLISKSQKRITKKGQGPVSKFRKWFRNLQFLCVSEVKKLLIFKKKILMWAVLVSPTNCESCQRECYRVGKHSGWQQLKNQDRPFSANMLNRSVCGITPGWCFSLVLLALFLTILRVLSA